MVDMRKESCARPNIFLSLFCARFMRAYFPVRDKIIFFIRKLEQFGAASWLEPGLIATQIFISGGARAASRIRPCAMIGAILLSGSS